MSTLRKWAAATVRKLVLSADGDAQQEQARLAATRTRWRIATGKVMGNPAPSSGRSTLSRLAADSLGQVFWRKVYNPESVHWFSVENLVLMYLGTEARSIEPDLSQHYGWAKTVTAAGTSSALSEAFTFDGGPNLDMWQDFAPCMCVGSDALPVPLFAQPVFLAAVVRQALIALDALRACQVVHGDLKPGNLCMALPLPWDVDKVLAKGNLNPRKLALRLIDFETAAAPRVSFVPHGAQNDNMSPYVRACHSAAAKAQVGAASACLAGIDWGADLWALGFMLGEWCEQAGAFSAAYLLAFGNSWGIGSAAHRAADTALAPLHAQRGFLEQFAAQLQAQERPVADAALPSPTVRADRPHRGLWGALEQKFRVLGPGAAEASWPITLINPEAPLDGDTGPAPWAAAAAHLRQANATFARFASRRGRGVAAAFRRQRRRITAVALLAALPALAWPWRADLRQASLQLSSQMAAGQLRAFQADGQGYQRQIGRTWLSLADVLRPGQADETLLRTLAELPAFDDTARPAEPQVLRPLRDRYLRALAQLAALPDAQLAAAETQALGRRLLLAAYHSGARLERADGAAAPGAGTDAAPDALARLHRLQGWPLAALLQVHLLSCYGPPTRHAELAAPLAALLALPAATESRAAYVAFAQTVAQRLSAGRPPCLMDPPAPGG